jgi:hypothetical protein
VPGPLGLFFNSWRICKLSLHYFLGDVRAFLDDQFRGKAVCFDKAGAFQRTTDDAANDRKADETLPRRVDPNKHTTRGAKPVDRGADTRRAPASSCRCVLAAGSGTLAGSASSRILAASASLATAIVVRKTSPQTAAQE